jgi:hypothetical protein
MTQNNVCPTFSDLQKINKKLTTYMNVNNKKMQIDY